MNITTPGWMHEDDNGDESEPAASPRDALINYLRHVRGNYEDDSDERQIEELDGTEHAICYMDERVLESEAQRDDELAGLDDEDYMLDLPIGAKFFRETKRVVYVVTVIDTGDEEAGAIHIHYARKGKK
jgi:hypothetical protein